MNNIHNVTFNYLFYYKIIPKRKLTIYSFWLPLHANCINVVYELILQYEIIIIIRDNYFETYDFNEYFLPNSVSGSARFITLRAVGTQNNAFTLCCSMILERKRRSL